VIKIGFIPQLCKQAEIDSLFFSPDVGIFIVMTVRNRIPGAPAALLSFVMLACCGSGSDVRPIGVETAPGRRPPAPTALRQNLTDVEILVRGIETDTGTGYLLRGTILSASAAGGAASLAEPGQSVTLTPYYAAGSPDPADAGERRLMELSSTPPGETVRCRIALDGRGAWRIISTK
jgi:hypothetical protein